MKEIALDFGELVGELRELTGHVVALEIRDGRGEVIASAEGKLRHAERSSGECSFLLGGDPSADGSGLPLHPASWSHFSIASRHILDVHAIASGIGAAIVLRVRLTDGLSFKLWPATPPEDQTSARRKEDHQWLE